ncbi:MAG: hypothetical protein JXP34_05350 [Planctomycetes bacterium]|nr:hypothetical protein [Planctomycetota bacterium]
MKKTLLVSTFLFIAANALLIRIDVVPWIRAARRSPYDATVDDLTEREREYRMRISLHGQRVGGLVQRARRLEDGYELRTTARLDGGVKPLAGILGLLSASGAAAATGGALDVDILTRLDAGRRLRRIEATIRLGALGGTIVGEVEGAALRFRQAGSEVPLYEIPYDPQTMVVSTLTPAMDRADLVEGKTWMTEFCDLSLPGFGGAPFRVLFQVLGEETIEAAGRRIRARRVTVRTDWGHREMTLWFDERGDLVRQDFYAWSLERE